MSRHPTQRMQQAPLPHIAAIYCRVSSVAQDAADKSSLQTQEAGCRAWAAANGWEVDDALVFRDTHSGEELWERPALTQLRDAAKQRGFALLICHSIDRLSRSPVHLGIVLEECSRLGIAVEFTTEALDDTPEAGLVRYIRGYAAMVENEKRRERCMRAVRAKAERGRPIASGRPPHGYLWADAAKSRLEADAGTAWVLQRLFRDYATGASLRGLATVLTQEHIPTPTTRGRGVWEPTTIRQLLTRSIYWGVPTALRTQAVPVRPDQRSRYARKSRAVPRPPAEQIVLPASIAPALVSPTLAASCQRRLRQNRQLASSIPKHPESALLRGLASCGACGASMHTNTAGHGQTTRYVCKRAIRLRKGTPGHCEPQRLSARAVDAVVWAQISDLLKHPALLRHEVEKLRDGPAPLTADIAAIDARAASIDKKMCSLVDAIALCGEPVARDSLAGRLDLLAKEQRGGARERAALEASLASWQSNYTRLDALHRELDGVAAEIDTWGLCAASHRIARVADARGIAPT
ncbi:MAG: recombinase family protein [Ktedonobacterales bacterium]